NRSPRVGARIVALSFIEERTTVKSANDVDLPIEDCSAESAPFLLHLRNHRPRVRCGIVALAVLPHLLPIVTSNNLEFSVEDAACGCATEMMHWSHRSPSWLCIGRIEHFHRVHRLSIESTGNITAID
ncbi:hypothetical protein PMAYCL1PPCAC_13552, partial [Pristionchus mayeri]